MIKHIMPIILDPEGFLVRTTNKYFVLTDCVEGYESYEDPLIAGIRLNNQFIGSFYNTETGLPGDFGSNLYMLEKIS